MNTFEQSLNSLLVDTFNSILKFEEISLRNILHTPVTISEAHVIEAIGKQGSGVTVSEIASSLDVALPTITVAVKKLESKGLVAKVPCTVDGRRSIISLTDAGKYIDRAHSIFHRRMVRDISRGFLDSEKDVLLGIIKKLGEFFKEKAEVPA